ncbi:TetR/AcrR family transcriptional regulator [Pseudolysinimonas sp.]
MGLRELKAERTRAALSAAATELFLAQGYDDTTMEQIAERAEVGASTLYRYFPTKDLLLLEWLVQSIDVGAKLAARPDDEPLEVALRAAILDSLLSPSPTGSHAQDVKLRRMIDESPTPRARLWDFVMQQRSGLNEEVARRMGGLPVTDMRVIATAGMASVVHYIVGDRLWEGDGYDHAETMLDEVIAELHAVTPVLPASPAPVRAVG